MWFRKRQHQNVHSGAPAAAAATDETSPPARAADHEPRSQPGSTEPTTAALPGTARELAELAQALAEQAAALRRQWQELSNALASGPEALALQPLRPPAVLPPEGAGQARADDPVQLVALSMAAAHSSRREIEEYLRTRLGVEDSRELLDGVFGPVDTEVPAVPRRRRGLFGPHDRARRRAQR